MSNDSDEDYAEFGTPLEPLDEDVCPRKKPYTIEEQFARDKHGRRRFHGAFTGGFSAGFLNTVGSLEGWKPSAFKSSRSEKAEKIQQKPEHFMDEEDTGEFGIAPSVLQAKDHFSSGTNAKRKHPHFGDSSPFGVSLLKNLLQPVRETVGIRLLKNMGWKPGQGVGPRVSKHEKQRISKLRKKVYGCALGPDASETTSDKDETDEEDDDDDDDDDGGGDGGDGDVDRVEWKDLTFAPDDCLPFSITPKENVFGIGYRGLDKVSILSVPQIQSDMSKKSIRGQAFGVGAFEEEDEDIYSREDMSQYDYSLTDPGKGDELTTSYTNREELYDDFVPSAKRAIKKVFPAPTVPKTFTGVHRVRVSHFEPLPPSQEPRVKLSDSPERENDVQRKARAMTGSGSVQIPCNKPFAGDADKQRRFENFLQLDSAAGRKDKPSPSLESVTMTEWERERERMEFQQAAKLFDPLNAVMDSRFTTASQPDDLNDPLAAVERSKTGTDDEQKAAKMNMYGQLTRKMDVWKPSSLLCKRFNIPELTANEIPIVAKKARPSIFDAMDSFKPEVRRREEEAPAAIPSPKANPEEEEKKKEEEEEEEAMGEEAPMQREEGVKPVELDFPDAKNKLDLFNAIFLDTDSEDEEEEEKEKEKEVKVVAERDGKAFDYEEEITNERRNTSPARGIFENLDSRVELVDDGGGGGRGERLGGRGREAASASEDVAPAAAAEAEAEESDLMYGPRLPDKITAPKCDQVYRSDPINVSHDVCWVEKSERRKERRNSKKYKKSKHKHKKRKKRKD